MYLFDLQKTINVEKVINLKKNKIFLTITANSKYSNAKSLFIIDSNSKIKNTYINEAIRKNIPAIVTNKYQSNIKKIPQFLVKNLENEKEKIIKKIYKYRPYKTIAITGTNGKTSVSWYISNIFNQLKIKNKILGTIGYFNNGKKIKDVQLTTPSYEELCNYGSSNKKIKYNFIFEASSHALDQNRLGKYKIDIAAITNISRDHLDYHKSMMSYRNAKFKLFTKHLSQSGIAIINSRIKNISTLEKKLLSKNIKIIYFGKKDIFFNKNKKAMTLKIFQNEYNIKNLNLCTDIEIENLECAISCCISLGIKEKKIIKILNKISNPPGRLQKINYKKNKSTIIVDYAHTPDALEKILISENTNNIKPILLFGCGGNRDRNKRKLMGKIANKLASKVYITDDNPRFESPSKIRKEIIKYCPKGIEISNRKKAINLAIKNLLKGEKLIIAGKGHEKFQIIKNKKIKFDDYKLVKRIVT